MGAWTLNKDDHHDVRGPRQQVVHDGEAGDQNHNEQDDNRNNEACGVSVNTLEHTELSGTSGSSSFTADGGKDEEDMKAKYAGDDSTAAVISPDKEDEEVTVEISAPLNTEEENERGGPR